MDIYGTLFVTFLVLEVTSAAKCYECTWADQEMTKERLDRKRTEKSDLERTAATIQWILFNDPYFGTEKVTSYPTHEDLQKECQKCDTTNPSRVCVRWHYFTDTSSPRENTLNVTWGCVRSNQLGCWRESVTSLITKEVCVCNENLCNSTPISESSTAVILMVAVLSAIMQESRTS